VIPHPDICCPHGQGLKVYNTSKPVELVSLGTKSAPEEVLELCPVHAKEFVLWKNALTCAHGVR